MLALWKMHQYYDTPGLRRTAATTTSSSRRGRGSAGRQARQPPTYLEMLERTARFVRQHMTDVKGTGEQYWQVGKGLPGAGAVSHDHHVGAATALVLR